MKAQAAEGDGVLLVEAPYGSGLYCQALALREAVLRQPLGLTLTEEERADDALRRHFCATDQGAVVGSVSLKKLKAPKTAADGYRNELDDAKWKPFKPDRDTCQFACDEAPATTNGGGDETPSGKGGQHQFPALRLLE